MYKIFLLAALLACAAAAPRTEADASIQVTRLESNADPDGNYSYNIEKTDGSAVSETGQAGHSAVGSFSYTSPEGVPVHVSYVADENGFQPQSDLLPVAPPIPFEIQRALEYIEKNPTPEEQEDRLRRQQQY
ncbi:larval cuticle protein 3 [Drosophila grimshawi]|uniref:GH16085 n=1 Tax=Drosophila grimshawi TaxID=7222 RepID=B4J357_DROGR|nr:larval cuticle protein 3 [Drosophila grimshawi]EDV96128.1 GH16085 [Drosophila grimshawi]